MASESAPIDMPNWSITYVGQPDDETGEIFVSLVALKVDNPTQDKWHITDDDVVAWMGSVIVHPDDSVNLYSDGGYDQQSNKGGAKFSAPLQDGGGANVRFPWESSKTMLYGTRGIHAAGGGAEYAIGFSAVDFLGGDDLGPGVASNKVYAAATGEVDYVCQDPTTTLIRTENTATDDYYIYAHLLENSTLTEGYTFNQGALIGSLKYGTFDDNCGWAEQTAQHYHLHFGFKPANNAFTLQGCVLDMSSEKWTCGTKEISTGQYLQATGGAPVVGDDGGALSGQLGFWDYILTGAVSVWDQLIVQNLPDHTTNQFLYALYNGVSIAVRIARVMVYSNLNLSHFFAVLFFALGVRAYLAIAEAIVFIAKAYKSLMAGYLGG